MQRRSYFSARFSRIRNPRIFGAPWQHHSELNSPTILLEHIDLPNQIWRVLASRFVFHAPQPTLTEINFSWKGSEPTTYKPLKTHPTFWQSRKNLTSALGARRLSQDSTIPL